MRQPKGRNQLKPLEKRSQRKTPRKKAGPRTEKDNQGFPQKSRGMQVTSHSKHRAMLVNRDQVRARAKKIFNPRVTAKIMPRLTDKSSMVICLFCPAVKRSGLSDISSLSGISKEV
jgi:hypothetical protein